MTATHPARISLKLRELNQLFNSMDPSPFLDRDLDHDAEEFIVSSARELHGARAYELVIHLGAAPDPARAAETPEAVQHYFRARAELKRREFRLLLRRGQTALVIGSLFLAACLVFSQTLARAFSPAVSEVVREGLTIVGWVAMWRPLEIFLYDWWPVRAEWRDLQRLARLRVRLVPPAARPAADSAAPVAHLDATTPPLSGLPR